MYRTQIVSFSAEKSNIHNIGYSQAEYPLGTQVFRKKDNA